jgi:hypothetical protein
VDLLSVDDARGRRHARRDVRPEAHVARLLLREDDLCAGEAGHLRGDEVEGEGRHLLDARNRDIRNAPVRARLF